jgi:hypothetical protein
MILIDFLFSQKARTAYLVFGFNIRVIANWGNLVENKMPFFFTTPNASV